MSKELQMRFMTEGSVEKVTSDGSLVSAIVRRLTSFIDRHSASMVCKLWNDAVTWETHNLSVRSRSILPLFLPRFSHINLLNFRPCFDQLEDGDLLLAVSSFRQLQTVVIGHPELPQEKVTDDGLSVLVKSSNNLQRLSLCCVSRLRDDGVLALAQGCRHLKSVNIESCRNLTDNALDALSNCKSLKELTLKGIFLFTPSGLSRIGEKCPGLLTVGFEFDSLDISLALKSLAVNCKKLENLYLKYRHGDLTELWRCSSLVRLYIETDNINNVDTQIMNIAVANKNLKEFTYFNRLAPLGDVAAIALVHNCRNLERLCLQASTLSESTLLSMMECKSLNGIALNHFCSQGRSLAAIGQSGMHLKEISVQFGRGIWDLELETLTRSNRELEQINLQCCLGPSSRSFSVIAVCTNLQRLDLSFTDVDNVSLAEIANGAKALRHLSLMKCEAVTEMKVLSNFRALECLNLDQCLFVNDEGLDFLVVGCSKLTDLSLAATRITDTGLSYLANCKLLRILKIPYCRRVQGPGLIAIAKSCSWLQYLVISHRFRASEVLYELKKQYCMIRLDVDNLTLVPFGFYALDVAPR